MKKFYWVCLEKGEVPELSVLIDLRSLWIVEAWKYLWARASEAEILLVGSASINLKRRLNASLSMELEGLMISFLILEIVGLFIL